MSHPLHQRLDDLRRRANRMRFVWGAARFVALAAAAWILLACVDATLRTSQPAWRWIALALWIVCVTLAFRRWTLPALRRPLTLEGTALEVERRFPALRDRLTDAIEFLQDRRFAEALGSATLRRRMINETWSRVEPLDLRSILSPRPVAIAAIFAIAAIELLVFGLALPNSPLRLASARLIAPWTDNEWPRRDELVVEPDVRALVRGGRFAIEVYDAKGDPPQVVKLDWRAEGGSGVQTFELNRRKDRFFFERASVETPFSYRVYGGEDDAMRERHVRLVDPARVVSLEALVTPPDYLNAYRGTIVSREPGFVRTLIGSTIDVELRLEPSPSIARLVFVPKGSKEEDAKRFDLLRDETRGLWTLPKETKWIPESSGEYFFEEGDGAILSWDAEHGGEPARYAIELVADGVPRVVVEGIRSGEPIAPGASLPYVATITDDVGFFDVRWSVHREGDPADKVEVDSRNFAYQWPKHWKIDEDAPPPEPFKHRTENGTFALDDPRVVPGTTWEAKLVAIDLAGNVGESATFRLPIVDEQRMAARIAERESRLLALLRESLRLLRDATQEVREVDLSVQSLGAVEPAVADRLQRAESNQRNAGGRLFRDEESALASIAVTLAAIRANGLDLPESIETLERTRAALEALRGGAFARADGGMRDSLAAARREEPPEPEAFRETLAETSTAQDASIAELDRLIAELTAWDDYRRFRDEIADLEREQQGIADAIAPIVEKRRQGENLSAQDRALAVQLAARQREVARRLGKAVDEMEQTAQAMRDRGASESETLQNSADVAHERGAEGWMQDAARRLETSDWTGAGESQAPIERALDEVARELDRRRERRLDRQASELRDAAGEARRLAQNERDENRTDSDRASDRQATEELKRKLERLGSRQAAEETAGARQAQAKASAAEQEGDQSQADQERSEAANRLDAAANEAENAAAQAEQRLADETLARMKDFFEGLKVREEGLRDESLRLAELGGEASDWTTGQLASVRALAVEQDAVADEAAGFAIATEAFKAFRLGLEGAEEQMRRAAALARRRRLEPDAIDAQNRAIERLSQLLAALEARDEAAEQPTEPPPEGGDANAGGGQPPPGNREQELNRLAEIRLLALMQEEILRRTQALEVQRSAAGDLTPELSEEYRSLAEEQGNLARLLEEYAQASAADEPPPEDPLDAERALEELPDPQAPQP